MIPATESTTASQSSRPHGILSVARAELKMLLRNRTAIVNTMLVPLSLIALILLISRNSGVGTPTDMLVISSILLGMSFVVYYNLVTTYVARRESYVLKRMRTGTVPDYGILIATAIPSLILALLQIVIVVIAAVIIGPIPNITNVIALVIALVLGFTVFTLLAAMSAPFTKTAETAQVTTMPLLLLTMGLSGLFFPLDILPDSVVSVARLTPGAAVVELLNVGLLGIDRHGNDVTDFTAGLFACLIPSIVLLAWTLFSASIVKERFAWEPRR